MKKPFLTGVLLAIASVAGTASAGPQKLLGFNVHQNADVGMESAHDAGLGWVRIDLSWTDAEPTKQATFQWSVFDAQVAAASAKNLQIVAILAYTPAWASSGDTKKDGTLNDVPTAGSYAAFVTAAVNRYKSSITHYELWNEPNLGQFFEGTPNDYVTRVLQPGADAVHAACPACSVMGPGVATVGGAYATWMDVVLSTSASKLDIVSGHVYASFPDLDASTGTSSDSFLNKLESHRVVKVGGATVYEGPLSLKEVMDQHAVNKPFWLTETGMEAAASDAAAEKSQVTYYQDVLGQMVSRPWWQATIFYESFDEPGTSTHWGAVVHTPAAGKSYTAKPVFDYLRTATATLPPFGGTAPDGGTVDASVDGGTMDAAIDASAGAASADGGPSEGAGAGADASTSTASVDLPGDGGNGCRTGRGPGAESDAALLLGVLVVVKRRRRARHG